MFCLFNNNASGCGGLRPQTPTGPQPLDYARDFRTPLVCNTIFTLFEALLPHSFLDGKG